MKLGLLFAGQGSQNVGMGRDFYEHSQDFRKIFDMLPAELRKMAFEGPMDKLSYTANTQPIMVAFGIGVMEELKKIFAEKGIKPEMAAGLSLGEYTALESAGVFEASTALRIVSLRGKAMAQAAEGIKCKMTAVLNLDREILRECVEEAGKYGKVGIANYNCPGQIVIAGEEEAVDKASELAKERGAGRLIPLAVSGPFHTAFMEPAGEVLREAFETVDFGELKYPVVFNAIGRVKKPEEEIKELLIKQVSGSVYFQDSIEEMERAGIDTIIEVGPGKALAGFVKKTSKVMRAISIEKFEDLDKVREFLEEEI